MRVFRFCYLSSHRPHQLRDGDAFVELAPRLGELRYAYGETIINCRTPPGEPDDSIETMLGLGVGPDDLLVLCTRPPLTEFAEKGRKVVQQSGTSLEGCVFDALKPYLRECERDHVYLTEDQATKLPAQFRDRALIDFFVNGRKDGSRPDASYRLIKPYRRDRGPFAACDATLTTAAYLIHTAPLVLPDGKRGPRVLNCFALSGTFTLGWAHILRRRMDLDLAVALAGPSFTMAEICVSRSRPIPRAPRDLTFTDSWKVDLIARAVS